MTTDTSAQRLWCTDLRRDDCGSCLSVSAAVEIHTCRALGPVGQSCRLLSLTCRPPRPA